MDCPCGSGEKRDGCCGPYVDGTKQAPTAEALMRSRYTAYVEDDVDYVIETHDPATRGQLDRSATRQWAEKTVWLGLDVLEVEGGGPDDDTAEVEFVARHDDGDGGARAHHERSRFRRVDGRWYFVEGEVKKAEPVTRSAPKVGRNDPCPCGSGKKHKKCCGRPGAATSR